jgi:putative acetyltransferase
VPSIAIESPRQPEILALLEEGDRYTLALYPPESCHLLSIDELDRPEVTVFVARSGGTAVGMASFVADDNATAEIKRMFVPAEFRQRGIAGALLRALEQHAGSSGIALLQLETGPLQPEAIRLYESAGYRLIPNFGKYAGDDNSVCYEKALP